MCAKRIPSFFVFFFFFESLYLAVIALSSLWKLALDQSMTVHKVNSQQWQTLGLSTPVAVYNKLVSAIRSTNTGDKF